MSFGFLWVLLGFFLLLGDANSDMAWVFAEVGFADDGFAEEGDPNISEVVIDLEPKEADAESDGQEDGEEEDDDAGLARNSPLAQKFYDRIKDVREQEGEEKGVDNFSEVVAEKKESKGHSEEEEAAVSGMTPLNWH